MCEFVPKKSDRVRIDIPDEADPDYDIYHGKHGQVIDIFSDEAGLVTGDESDSIIYRIEFEDSTWADFRSRDLRPPIE